MMNRTKIEWTDFSWNPIVGCKHGCWYCYAKKLCQRFKKIFPNGFEPTFYHERLTEPWDYLKPSKIFVCSIADLFASWTPTAWRAMQTLNRLARIVRTEGPLDHGVLAVKAGMAPSTLFGYRDALLALFPDVRFDRGEYSSVQAKEKAPETEKPGVDSGGLAGGGS
jgi:hypothetical protein